ncbi:MAG TPA: hypothetical protein ENJ45_03200 [Phaeodactylibacter sp.]|nr:hypothetical protein [Phaeodactylibacter sp.]
MTLSEFKKIIADVEQLAFQLPCGEMVPPHFHVTEVGKITKDFIDCGGMLRKEQKVNFQLWYSVDTEHRLKGSKLLQIIELCEDRLLLGDAEIEVEYQSDTIGKYALGFDGNKFLLLAKRTDCLAKDNCGIPEEKVKTKLADIGNTSDACCPPGGGCC